MPSDLSGIFRLSNTNETRKRSVGFCNEVLSAPRAGTFMNFTSDHTLIRKLRGSSGCRLDHSGYTCSSSSVPEGSFRTFHSSLRLFSNSPMIDYLVCTCDIQAPYGTSYRQDVEPR